MLLRLIGQVSQQKHSGFSQAAGLGGARAPITLEKWEEPGVPRGGSSHFQSGSREASREEWLLGGAWKAGNSNLPLPDQLWESWAAEYVPGGEAVALQGFSHQGWGRESLPPHPLGMLARERMGRGVAGEVLLPAWEAWGE